jgi:ABC-type polysaccharide/polyol phosphate export permease
MTSSASDHPGVAAEPVEPPDSVDAPTRSVLADLRASAHDLWSVRGLLYELTLRDVRVRYKQAALGMLWALLTPALVVLAGVTVRTAIAFSGGAPPDRAALATIAVKAVPWAFFAGSLGFATGSLTANATLLTKVAFPREVLPVSSVLAHVVDMGAGLLAVGVLLLVLGVAPGPAVAWLPLLLALLVLLTLALGLVLSCANLFFRDVKYIVQVLITFGIFFTPVFFEPSMLGPRGARLIMLNPLAPILEGIRLAAVEGHNLMAPLVASSGIAVWHPWHLAYSAVWSVGGFVAGTVFFARLERLFADYA